MKLSIIDNTLTIHVNTASQKYRRGVELTTPVKAEPIDITCKSGVFKVKLEK